MRKTVNPTLDERGAETHPAFALIGAARVSAGPPGAVLFDSEIRHQHFVTIRISEAKRHRELNRDRVYAQKQIVEVSMSEAQWASFVSSMNAGDGVPCTLATRETDWDIPGLPYEPRMAHSLDEVYGAADRALAEIREALAVVETKPTKANLRTLRARIENAPSNMRFAADSLSEHAENTVQKARADIEAMISQAQRLGLEPSDVGVMLQLPEGNPEEEDS